MSFFSELKRRNVFRVGIAYALIAWVVLQAADFAFDLLGAPNWLLQALAVIAVLGLPGVLVFAWVFEMTPEGLRRESQIDRSRSITPQTGRKLDRAIIVFLAVAVALLLGERFYSAQQQVPADAGTPTGATVDAAPAASEVPSIAVLPFVNMSADPEQEYFSDGLAEELLNRLAQTKGLRVAARTSAFQFKGRNLDVSEIGRQLGVNHVLEGSVRKAGKRLRVTAQLINVADGFHLWSETYERELDDVFAIQDEISAAITGALESRLGMAPPEVVGAERPTGNVQAYEIYLQARYDMARRGGENLLRAEALFRQAVELDPDFDRAWSGLAFCYGVLPNYSDQIPPGEAMRLAQEAAKRALAIDADNAEAYTALARAQGSYWGEYEAARTNFEKAFELAPRDANVVNLYGDFLTITGDFQRAEAMERLAVELDPLAAVQHSDLASLLLALHRPEEALESAQTSARLEPGLPARQRPLIIAMILLGRFDEAQGLIEQFSEEPGAMGGRVSVWQGLLAMYRGDREAVRTVLAAQAGKVGSGGDYLNYSEAAFLTAWADGVAAALPLLEKAYETQEYQLTWPEYFYLPEGVSTDPDWLAFWEQPRLAGLVALRRANHPDTAVGYWKAEGEP